MAGILRTRALCEWSACLMLLAVGSGLGACRPTDYPTGEGPLEVADTLYFDTLVALVPHPYQYMVVRNLGTEDATIHRIRLAGGRASPFRMNVDGLAVTELENYVVEGRDSFWVFVEVKETYVPSSAVEVTVDSIEFTIGDSTWRTVLHAVMVAADLIEDSVLACSSRWTAGRRLLLGGDVVVPPGCRLTIEEGVTAFVKPRGRLIVYGELVVNGAPNRKVRFTGTRLDDMHGPDYPAKQRPGQWDGIFLVNPSGGIRLQNLIIENGTIGLYAVDAANPSVWMDNVIIRRHAGVGIWAKRSTIEAYDLILNQACASLMVLDSGGDYRFYHTTAVNEPCGWCGYRKTPSIQLSNRGGHDLTFHFANGIVWGDRPDEVQVVQADGGFSVTFERSVVRDSMDGFSAVEVWNQSPGLEAPCDEAPFPDSNAFIIDRGRPLALPPLQYDVMGKWRGDGKPDLGAYEF